MRLLSLNTWGGRLFDPLAAFIANQAGQTDIFCLQEVYSTSTKRIFTREPHEISGESMWESKHPTRANTFQELQTILHDFQGFYHTSQDKYDYHGPTNYDLSFGLAMFIRHGIEVMEEGDLFVFRSKNSVVGRDSRTLGRNLQYARIKHAEDVYTVVNFHGLWNGAGKTDTEARLEQSKKVAAFLRRSPGKKILCGDFNLLPDTQSLAILEHGMKNLIKDYGITSTRSEHYEKPEKFADYILVSPNIQVHDFQVLQEPVSDHLPLVVAFE